MGNKAEARDWHAAQAQHAQMVACFEAASEVLRHLAINSRSSQFPSADDIRAMGPNYAGIADKITAAKNLLREAEAMLTALKEPHNA